MNIINMDNSGKWCKRCSLPILQDVFIDIKSNANMEIYEIKIEEMMLLCDVCQNRNYKIECLWNKIEDEKDCIKTLSKELFYNNEMFKRFHEKLLNLEWENYWFSIIILFTYFMSIEILNSYVCVPRIGYL